MIELSDQQHQAVKTVVSRIKGVLTPEPLTYIAGLAGTGKSTILPFILDELGVDPSKVCFAAPTGKAAKVMRNKLRDQSYPKFDTSTIHSLIYRARPVPFASLEADLNQHMQAFEEARKIDAPADELKKLARWIKRLQKELDDAYREDKISFQLNEESILSMAQLLVVDEASMVGKSMAEDLMAFGVPILALGDPGQLPPVKDDAGLTAGTPDFFLSEIHRQAKDNPILRLAHTARTGDIPKLGDYGQGVRVLRARDYDHDFSVPDQPQFICGTNKTRWKYTHVLREGFGIDPAIGPQSGEPLIVKKNVKDRRDLVNGLMLTCGSCTDMIDGQSVMTMDFEDEDSKRYTQERVWQGLFEENVKKEKGAYSADSRAAYRARKIAIEMDFSYVITAHSSQGSQWDDVIVREESSVFKEDAHKWSYTAYSRAAKTLTVLV